MKLIRDGDDDPLHDDPLAKRRREALHAALQLMDCHCLKAADCDHVDVLRAIVEVTMEGTLITAMHAIRQSPRPFTMASIERELRKIGVLTMLSADPKHEEEHR